MYVDNSYAQTLVNTSANSITNGFYFNSTNFHSSLPTFYWSGYLSAGDHVITFESSNSNITSDGTDIIEISVIEN